jgi:hypothetical protein
VGDIRTEVALGLVGDRCNLRVVQVTFERVIDSRIVMGTLSAFDWIGLGYSLACQIMEGIIEKNLQVVLAPRGEADEVGKTQDWVLYPLITFIKHYDKTLVVVHCTTRHFTLGRTVVRVPVALRKKKTLALSTRPFW